MDLAWLAVSLAMGVFLAGCAGGWQGAIRTPPMIVVQPVTQSAHLGSSVTFAVTVSGMGPFTYQWFAGGTAISGATASSYTIPTTTTSDNGTVYTVVVSNAVGTVTSVSATLTITAAALQSIAVTPVNPSIAKGATQTFVAIGTYTDGTTKNISSSVTWASGNSAVATINAATGVASGISAGTSPITATLGSIVSPADTLTVTAPTLLSIAITPGSASITKGATQQFTATGTYSDGSTQNITSSVVWSSSAAGIATVGAATGLATGAGVGTAQITATLGSVVSPADTLTVKPPTLLSIAVTPTNPSVAKGNTQQLTATGTYSDGSTQNITSSVVWSSSAAGIATVGAATGLATGAGVGTAQVTATQGSIVSPADTLTVTPPVLVSIAVTPANASIAKGTTQQFVATGTYSDGSTQNITSNVAWSSSVAGVATVGAATGLATGAGVGAAQITATLGSVVSPGDTLTITPPTLLSIAVSPANPTLIKNTAQQFTAIGTYTGGSTQDITSAVTWASTAPAVVTIGAGSGLSSAVGIGSSMITATQGAVVSPADTVMVINSTPVASNLACSTTTPLFNGSIGLTPTFSGGTATIGSTGVGSSDITASAVAGISYPTPNIVSAKTYTLTVTGTGGNTASTSCSVTPATVVISGIMPANQTVAPGMIMFSAVVSGGALGTVTWSATGGSFSGGTWTSPNTPGTFTITATSVDNPAVSLSTTITVSVPIIGT